MNTMPNESTPFRQKGEPSDDDLMRLAYEYWQERGCPDGSPEIDWLKAEQTFRARNAAGQDNEATCWLGEQAQASGHNRVS